MAFVRLLKDLMKDKEIGHRFVPIIPDEARTFGMDAMFPTAKIYSPHGQTYDAVDRELLLSYKESEQGQILHEGISEAGSMGSAIAAGSAYATHGEHMIPIYIFYSMFGFQRTGDQMWALADQLGRGLPARRHRRPHHAQRRGPAARGRPLAAARLDQPGVRLLRPGVGVRGGAHRQGRAAPDVRRGAPEGEDVFYYLTVYNEPYPQPAEPVRTSTGRACSGLYRFAAAPDVDGEAPRAQILATGVGRSAGPWRRSGCWPRTGAWPPTCGRPRPGPSCGARRSPARSTTCCTPRRDQRVPYVTQALRRPSRARSSR